MTPDQPTTPPGYPSLDPLFGNQAGGPPAEPPPAPAGIATSPGDAPPPSDPPETPAPPEPSLAALIRQGREERRGRQEREREAGDLRQKVQELEARLSKNQKADLLTDPVAFAEAHGLSQQDMALIGQTLLYHLVPDKAPADLRVRLLEARMARERKAEEDRRRSDTERANAEAQAHLIRNYTASVKGAVQSFGDGDFPSSRAWFSGNQDEYTESLVHTARNIATAAQARGEEADLSPRAVAAVLERDIAARARRFRPEQATPASGAPAGNAPVGGKQPAVLSTRGQGGSPAPAATTDEERFKRAVLAAFSDR